MSVNRNCVNTTAAGTYPLLGPIETNTPFYLTYTRDNILYTLTYVQGSSSSSPGRLIFDPRPANFLPLVGTASGSGFVFSFTGGSDLAIGTTNCLFTPNSTGEIIIPTNANFSQWAMLLTGVPYVMNIPAKNNNCTAPQWLTFEATTESMTQPGFADNIKSSDPVQISLNQIYAIPQTIFRCGDCDTPGGGVIQPALLFEACTISGGFASNPEACQASILGSEYYSNLSDCTTGVWYKYCSNGQDCSAGCRGPCSMTGLDCLFDGQIPGFKCETPPKPEKPIYEQEWFWALAAGLIVTLIVVLIILFYVLDN